MSWFEIRLVSICSLLVCSAHAFSASDERDVLHGTVEHIIDGDTVGVRLGSEATQVDLHGIDAPEHDQPYGAQASKVLTELAEGKEVALAVVAEPHDDAPLIAVLMLGDEDINARLVRDGSAWANRQHLGRYEGDERYCKLEHDARSKRRGLWRLPPMERIAPWEWRDPDAEYLSDYEKESAKNCIATAHGRGQRPSPMMMRVAP